MHFDRMHSKIQKKTWLTYFQPGCHFGLWSLWTPDELWQQRVNHPKRRNSFTLTIKKPPKKTSEIVEFVCVNVLHCTHSSTVGKSTKPIVQSGCSSCVLWNDTHTGLLLSPLSMWTIPSISALSSNFTVCSPIVSAFIDMDAFLRQKEAFNMQKTETHWTNGNALTDLRSVQRKVMYICVALLSSRIMDSRLAGLMLHSRLASLLILATIISSAR